MAERRPTPRPAKKRPATKRGIEVEMVWRTTPKQKTKLSMIIPHRRPTVSAIGAAPRAPKKVPAERRETIIDDSEEVTSGK